MTTRRESNVPPVSVSASPLLRGGTVAGEAAARGDGRRTWTVHVVADTDSRWKWGVTLARRLSEQPVEVRGHLVRGRATPSDHQLSDIGAEVTALRRVGLAELIDSLADPTSAGDVIVLACVGGTIGSLIQGLRRAWGSASRRPVVVTGYVGLVYENIVDGLLLRAGADVVLANSAHDAAEFRDALAEFGIDTAAVVRTALPFLGGAPYDPTAAGRDRPFTLTFAAQPSVPVT